MIRLVVLLLLVGATQVQADPKSEAAAAFSDGQRRYVAGEYDSAARQFVIAYSLDPDPAYLFNIAQAYRSGNQCARAAKYYRRFLEVVRDPPNKADVAKFIAEQDACAKTQPPPGPDFVPATKPEPKLVEPKPEPAPEPIRPTKSTGYDPGRFRRTLAIPLFVVGAFGIGTGVAIAFRIESLEREREGLCPDPSVPCEGLMAADRDYRSRASTYRAAMISGFVTGGIATAAATYLYITGRQRRRESVAVMPTRGGALVSFTFAR